MRTSHRKLTGSALKLAAFSLLAVALFAGATYLSSVSVEANHPVLVEGNCDSPVPFTTIVSPGTCGDFDGDSRIGTAEDTDGADRIFGTINAALGPGTGAAAGTGANFNGRVTIVASGRFAENVFIGNNLTGPGGVGIETPGNVTLEAAPGVAAILDAVLQGDSAANNNARQGARGIQVTYNGMFGPTRVVVLRNLTVRNYAVGIGADNFSRVHIDNCRLDSNIDFGIRLDDQSRTVVLNSQVTNTGYRVGSATSTANPGHGFYAEDNAQARLHDTVISHSSNGGIVNNTGNGANVVIFNVGTYFNGINISGPVTREGGNSTNSPEEVDTTTTTTTSRRK